MEENVKKNVKNWSYKNNVWESTTEPFSNFGHFSLFRDSI